MNATRNVLLRPRMLLPMGQRRRLIHSVSSAVDTIKTKTTHKQSQNNLSAVPSFEERIIQTPAFPQPSAEDIQRLLSNIGAGHRASLPTIESMIQKNNNAAAAADNAADRPSTEITANEMIDLIAQIRSL